jgi:hypothetical protein
LEKQKSSFNWKFVVRAMLLSSVFVISCGVIYTFAFLHGLVAGTSGQRAAVNAGEKTKVNANALFTGTIKLPAESFTIPINPPASLSGLTRAQVYKLREDAVLQHNELVFGKYRPYDGVFGRIEDGKPWWGIVGQFYRGPGSRSPEGPSEESRFILNPFLLVAPEFFGLSFYDGGHLQWSGQVTAQDLARESFPFVCKPQDLKWFPREASAQVTYDVSKHIEQLNRYTSKPLSINDLKFGLTAYNARDLGFNYLAISEDKTENVINEHGVLKAPVELRQFIHCGGSCGYPGGCNNMSPNVFETDDLKITRLPAQLQLYLWRGQPQSSQDVPDMTFTIKVK